MRIGSSIALTAIGLILALAVNIRVPGLDLHQIGWILAIVGVVGLIISLVLFRRARPVVTRQPYPPTVGPDPYASPRDPAIDQRDPNTRY